MLILEELESVKDLELLRVHCQITPMSSKQVSPDPSGWAMKILFRYEPGGIPWVRTGFSSYKWGSSTLKKSLVEKKLLSQGFSEEAAAALNNNEHCRAEALTIIWTLICKHLNCKPPSTVPSGCMDPGVSKNMLLARLELVAPSLSAEIQDNKALIRTLYM